jgi:hypothetical protein
VNATYGCRKRSGRTRLISIEDSPVAKAIADVKGKIMGRQPEGRLHLDQRLMPAVTRPIG